MKFIDLFNYYVDKAFRGSEAEQAIEEFMHHIPGRVTQIEFNVAKSNKQGIVDGNKVYKMGLDVEAQAVYMQYFDDRNQGQPTMAIAVNRHDRTVIVNGWQIDKRMLIRFSVGADGKVEKTVRVEQ